MSRGLIKFQITLFTLLIIGAGCSHLSIDPATKTALVVEENLVKCFPKSTKYSDGRKVSCEVSAAAYIDGKIYTASDKPVPEPRSSFFVFNSKGSLDDISSFLVSPIFKSIQKTEDMAVDFENKRVFAITGFDRIKTSNHSWDSFNTLFVFEKDNEDEVKVFNKEINEGHVSSLYIRDLLKEAIKRPYFKTEGLAYLGEGKLLIGVREVGGSYKTPENVIKVYQLRFKEKNGEFFAEGKLEELFSVDPLTLNKELPLSLSSIEYNRKDNSLFMLTSYELAENDEAIGAFLWKASLNNIKDKTLKLTPVLDKNGDQVHFAHKAEGLTILPGNKVLVVHDDDRVKGRKEITNPKTQFHRPRHKFAYTIIEFK